MSVPKRIADRIGRGITKFQEVIRVAKDRDVNEADTVTIIKDILAEVFGYDKFVDLTSEFSVRSTFCDVAIKVENKIEYLLEAKAIGIDLKENHLRQAVDYGANNGIQWVLLTNGVMWELHKIKFEQPINHQLVCSFNFLELDPKNEEHRAKLFILCKEGVTKDVREDYHEKIETLNRFILGALITSDEIIGMIRREIRKVSDGVLVDPESIMQVLKNEVIKREVIEGDEAVKAQSRVRRYYSRASRKTQDETETP